MTETNLTIAKFLGLIYNSTLGWYDNNDVMSKEVFEVEDGNCYRALKFSTSTVWLDSAINYLESKSFSVCVISTLTDSKERLITVEVWDSSKFSMISKGEGSTRLGVIPKVLEKAIDYILETT